MPGPLLASAKPPPVIAATRSVPTVVRLNQAGYAPGESKQALVMTPDSLDGQPFKVVSDRGTTVLAGQIGLDRGPYGRFGHLYELNFSTIHQPGRYKVIIGKTESPSFDVADTVCDRLIAPTIDFYQVQRCGDQPAQLHGACHVDDGVAVGGPNDGKPVPAAGGWHDAGDYLKFMVTTGVSDLLMLTAYQRHPQAFASGTPEPKVLQEARVGLDWMLRMWDPDGQVLYYQAGDAADHDDWRMPEGDKGPRKVWACEPGKGANLAGKTAASLALASVLYNDSTQAYYNPTLAATYLRGAEQLYRWGKLNPGAQSTNPSDFYGATGWKDDMALAAAELYRATGQDAYRTEGEAYAVEAGSAPFDVDHVHALAHYELARLDPAYRTTAAAFLDADLAPLQQHAESDPFHSALSKFTWGSVEFLTGTALEARWHEDLTGSRKYHELAQQQRDYILGCNPWGISMVSGIGSTWAHHPHHQVADITHSDIPGIWAQGPCNAADWKAQNIHLGSPDAFAAFQTPQALFHDDVQDYVTNEPTINTNALGLALSSWYSSRN